MTLLKIDNVRHRFDGPEVVRDVSFELHPGEFLCLLGPSGCGKTTLLRLAAGLEHVQQGVVSLGDQVVGDGQGKHVPPEKRHVGLMFQDFALFPHLTVRQNIAFGIKKMTDKCRGWIQQTAERMGIAELMDVYPHTLSGGQQQRVALVRALAPNPQALLLDEPFSGLDITRRAQVREETLALVQDTGTAALMVTHDPEEAMFMADRILVMHEGRIVQAGTPAETYFSPANAYVAGLFGPVNRIQGKVKNGVVKTALAEFAAKNLADGAEVEILIRPEGVIVQHSGKGCAAKVVNARLLGNGSHLRLAAECRATDSMGLQARVPGVFLPERGNEVQVSVDPAHAFVFVL
jgi:iron(III) transport system ATP-binding protein